MKDLKILLKNLVNLIFYFFSTLPLKNNLKLSHDKTFADNFNSEKFKIEYESDYSKYLKTFNLPENSGGINIGDQKALYFLTKLYTPTKILELGTHIGCSTINFLMASKKIKILKTLLQWILEISMMKKFQIGKNIVLHFLQKKCLKK